jgi:hypothetical protein
MINIETLFDYIESTTGYTIEFAKENEQELPEDLVLPKLTLGYGPIRRTRPESEFALGEYETQAENLIQSFYVKIICKQEDFRPAFIILYKALQSYNPSPSTYVGTSFNYVNGEPIGLSNGTFWYITEWKIGFPTNSILNPL